MYNLRNGINTETTLLLSAVKFNRDDVYTRCILYKTAGDIFAADIMYHKNCMTNYIVKFQRDINELMDDKDDQCDDENMKAFFVEMLETLELKKRGYAVSDCRDVLKNKLLEAGIGKLSSFHSICTILLMVKTVFWNEVTVDE